MTNESLLELLEKRFRQNAHRHPTLEWDQWRSVLVKNNACIETAKAMEESGGEPDIVDFNRSENRFGLVDCAKETPKGRRSLCYDRAAWESRKKYKPENNAVDVAREMGLELLTEADYLALQSIESFDTKTSSWIYTPESIRSKGGALFGDHRFGRSFIYHNGAESYYGVRGFRGVLFIRMDS